MEKQVFESHTSVSLPSGTFIFFPSLEQRARERRGTWLTITAYDAADEAIDIPVGSTIHAGLRLEEFRALERSLLERDLEADALVIEFERRGAHEVSVRRSNRGALEIRRASDIRALGGVVEADEEELTGTR